MDINDVIKAKIEMENSIRDAVREAMERFEKETGVTPSRIDIHLISEEIISQGAISFEALDVSSGVNLISEKIINQGEISSRRVRHAVIGVEATITL